MHCQILLCASLHFSWCSTNDRLLHLLASVLTLLCKGILGWVPAERFLNGNVFLHNTGNTSRAAQQQPSLPPCPSTVPVPKPSKSMDKNQVMDMTPAEKTKNLTEELDNMDTFPVEIPVREEIGKLGLMWPRSYAEFHWATPLLNSYAIDGCPVQCGPDWSKEKILKF
jgi:hypothetical protein